MVVQHWGLIKQQFIEWWFLKWFISTGGSSTGNVVHQSHAPTRQSFADALTEKINQRPTAVFAQEIWERHLTSTHQPTHPWVWANTSCQQSMVRMLMISWLLDAMGLLFLALRSKRSVMSLRDMHETWDVGEISLKRVPWVTRRSLASLEVVQSAVRMGRVPAAMG